MSTITVSTSAALNAAMQTAHAGDTILLKAGTYAGVSVKNTNVAGNVTVTSADLAHEAVITDLKITSSSGFTFQNLEVFSNATSPANGVVIVSSSSNITLDRLDIHGSLNDDPTDDKLGVSVMNSSNVNVTNSEFHQLRVGIGHQDSEKVNISQNYFHELRTDGVSGGGTSNITVQNNYFTNFSKLAADHADAIQFFSGVKNVTASGIVVKGNVISQGEGDQFQGIFMRTVTGEFKQVVISDNLILGGQYNGIVVENGNGIRVTDNTIVSRPDALAWIGFKDTEGLVVSGNTAAQFNYVGTTPLSQTGNAINISASDDGAAALRAWMGSHGADKALLPVEAGVSLATTVVADLDSVITAGSKTLGLTSHNLTLSGAVNADGAGNALDNVVVGNGANNKIYGYGGNDTIEGGAGDDLIDGGLGNDTASFEHAAVGVNVALLRWDGSSCNGVYQVTGVGKDTLTNIENVRGSAFNDTLSGDGGANVLEGGAGADSLIGDGGADRLVGGAGADTFFFKALSHSTVSLTGRDTIVDFRHSDGDIINISKIDANEALAGDQKFAQVNAFTSKAGQLVIGFDKDHYVVQGDTNGDGNADFAINVYSTTSLSGSDFLF